MIGSVDEEVNNPYAKRGIKVQVLKIRDEFGGGDNFECNAVVNEQQPDMCAPIVQRVSTA